MDKSEFPAIPDKLYFSIGEVAKLCDLQPHVLRYWEQEFPQLNPSRRRGSRRYYQRKDVLMVRKIRHLLYDKGFTIDGARKQLTGLDATSAKKNTAINRAVNDLESLLTDIE